MESVLSGIAPEIDAGICTARTPFTPCCTLPLRQEFCICLSCSMPAFQLRFEGASRTLKRELDIDTELEGILETWNACRRIAAHLEYGQRLENLATRMAYLSSIGNRKRRKTNSGYGGNDHPCDHFPSTSNSQVDKKTFELTRPKQSTIKPQSTSTATVGLFRKAHTIFENVEKHIRNHGPASFLALAFDTSSKPIFSLPMRTFLDDQMPTPSNLMNMSSPNETNESHDPYILNDSELYILPDPSLPRLLHSISEEDDDLLDSPSTIHVSSPVLFVNPFAPQEAGEKLPTPPHSPSTVDSVPPLLTSHEDTTSVDMLKPMDLTGQIQKLMDPAIAYGGASDIYYGLWRLPVPKKVAVKVLRTTNINRVEDVKRRLRREMDLWWMCRHQNIVPLYGYASDFSNLDAMVSPWMKNGSATAYLKTKKFSWSIRWKLLSDVVAGLKYLHHFQPPIVHGDLKPTNILISDSGDACLCDFGLSRVIKREGGPSGFTTSNFAGSVRYMAPELFRESEDEECMPIVNTATDIYAVGCIGLEMATDQIPYANRNLESQVIYDIICGVLPAREPSRFTLASNPTLGKLWNMMLATWNEDANSRPDINAVMKMVADCMPHSELPLVAASQAPLNIPTALRSRTSSQARVYTETSTSSYYTQLDHREPLASSILTNSTLPSSAKSFLRCRSADLPSQDDRLSSSLPRNPFTKRRHSASSVLDGSTIIG